MSLFPTLSRNADFAAHDADADARPWPMRPLSNGSDMAASCGPVGRQAVRKMPMNSPMRRADDHRDAWKVDAWWRRYGDTQLNSLMALALKDRPDVGVATARIDQALRHARQHETEMAPVGQATEIPPAWRDSIARVATELDVWSGQCSRFAAATSRAEAALAGLAHATRALTSSIATAYFEFNGLHARLADAVTALKSHERTRALWRLRLAHRLEMQHGMRQLEAREARTLENMLSIDASIARQRCVIAALTGEADATRRALVRPALAVDGFQRLPYSIPLDLLGRRPDLLVHNRLVDATSRPGDSAAACFYPDINLSSLIGRQPVGLGQLSQDRSTPGGCGLARRLPIHDRVRLNPDGAATPDAHDDAIDDYRASLVRALNEVVDTARDQLALDAQLALAHAAVSSASEASTSLQDRYCAGTASGSDILRCEDDLHATRHELVELQMRRLHLDAAMAHALGGGFDLFAQSNQG